MNKSYRIVWNRLRNCLMVVSEAAKSQGKSGGKKAAVVGAVSAAIMGIGGQSALLLNTLATSGVATMAQPAIVGGAVVAAGLGLMASPVQATTTIISTLVTMPVILSNGDSLLVTNTGTISVTATGSNAVYIPNGNTVNFINNSGSVAGGWAGIKVQQSTLSGGTSNSGSVAGGYIGVLYTSQSSLNGGFANTGSINGGWDGIVFEKQSNLSGGIVNSGRIEGINNRGINVEQSSLSGGLDNSGYIVGSGKGVSVFQSSLDDGIANSGSIVGGGTGINLQSTNLNGGITNTGSIAGGQYGILLSHSSLVGAINNSGSVTAITALAVRYSTISGDILNRGLLDDSPPGAGVLVSHSSIAGLIVNSIGGIIAGYSGLKLSRSVIAGGIRNEGSIRGNNIAGIGLAGSIVSGGGVANRGNITGGSIGLLVTASTINGGVQNQPNGTIGGSQYGIRVIQSGSSVASQINGGITNAGLIAGSVNSINIDSASFIDRIVVAGRDTAHFLGDVYAPNTPVTLAGEAVYTLDTNYTVSGFKNSGALALQPSVAYTINGGNYYQDTTASLIVGVANTTTGQYGSVLADGSAIFGTNSGIEVRLGTASGLVDGSTIAGVFSATGVIASAGFKVVDNSVYYDFSASVTGANHQIDVIASTISGMCTGNLSGANAGPCVVGYDAPYLSLASNGTITSTASGIVVLPGTIDGSATVGIVGITNAGTLSAAQYGIHVLSESHFLGGITNSGSIAGSFGGIRLEPNAVVGGAIQNSGTISGIRLLTGAEIQGGLHNDGFIGAYSSGINLQKSTLSGGLLNSGTLQGIHYAGIYSVSSQLNGGVTNTGLIGLGNASITFVNSTVAGGISNSGVLNGANAGVVLAATKLIGDIQNTGTISAGAGNGFYIVGSSGVNPAVSVIDGSIVNTGSIYALYSAIGIGGAVINGDINNAGALRGSSISGAALGVGYAQVNGNLINTGSVAGHAYGVFISNSTISGGLQNLNGAIVSSENAGLVVVNSILSNGITNAGVIQGANSSGIAITGSKVLGGLSNLAGGSISGLDGIRLNSTGTVSGGIANDGYISRINNAGLITSSGNAIYLGRDSGISFGISNAGLIQGDSLGVSVYGATVNGTLLNNNGGRILGSGAGLSLNESRLNSDLSNAGTIYGVFNAVNLTRSSISGSLINSGLLSGANGEGIRIYQSSLESISNAGTINSHNQGVWLTGSSMSGGIHNIGVINSGYVFAGVQVDNSSINSIINDGTVIGNKVAIGINASTIAGGITNAGMVYGYSNAAISVSGNTIDILNAVSGTIVGSINGALNLTNSGLIALQSWISGVVVQGSHVSANISGNYYQSANGTLQIGVDGLGVGGSGTLVGNYSKLNVGGVAVFENDSAIKVSMSARDAVNLGGTLSGVVVATGGLTSNGFIIKDNSTLVDFVASTSAGALDLVAIANQAACASTISGSEAGPCEIGIDKQGMSILVGGRISGASAGINVLSGAITAGGVVNAGTIMGNSHGVVFLPATTFTGNAINSGLIRGDVTAGVALNNATIVGQIINTIGGAIIGGINGIKLFGSALTGGITNEGLIQGLSSSGVAIVSSQLDGGIRNLTGGTVSGTANYSSFSSSTFDGGINIVGSTLSGGIDNAGLIKSDQSSGSYYDYGAGAINLVGSFLSDGINNQAIGVIAGDSVGIKLGGWSSSGIYNAPSQIDGGVTNSGLITGNFASIMAFQSTIGGSIQNDGIIAGGIVGLFAQGASISGGIRNAGTINGGFGAFIGIASAIEGGITNTGLIQGGSFGGYGGIALLSSYVTGGIQNSGSIASMGITGGSSLGGGAINLVGSQLTGGITNSGLIQGASGPGLQINQSLLDGGFRNLSGGTVSGAVGVQLGYAYGSSSSYYYQNQGSTLSGGLVNSGLIQGTTGAGVEVVGSALIGDLVNNVGATINGGGSGIYIAAGLSGSPLSLNFIRSSVSGSILNSGLVSGGSGAGIALNNSDITGHIINNAEGAIAGAVGISLLNSTINGSITNAGLIAGGVNSIYIDSGSSVDRIVIAGANTASFGGAVYAPNTSVTVAGGATYTLNSNFEVSNFHNQGTLAVPVSSIATPTITGNLTLGNSGTFSPTIASQISYSQVTVTGNVSVAGALAVNAAAVTSTVRGSTLGGIITGSTVTGTFAAYSDNSVLYDFVPVYSGTMVGLAIVQNSQGNTIYNAAKNTGNTAALGAASALDAISGMPGVMTAVTAAFGQMTSNQQISNALSQTLPGLSAATPVQTLAVLSAINQSIESRSLKLRGVSSGETFYGNSSVWMKPFGSWMNQGNMNGAYGFKANSGGLMLGADHQPTLDTKIGAAFAWGNSSANSNMAGQSQTSNLYQFIGYGTHALTDSINLNGQANGGWNNNSSNRQIGFMGTSAQASYSSAVWHAGLGLDSPQHLTEATSFIPQLRYDYTWIRNSGYNETGANYGLGLNVAAQTYQTSVLSTDGKVIHKLNDYHSVNANLGVGYNFSPTQTWVASSFQGSPGLQFTTNGVNPSAVMGRAGVGYNYKIKENVDVGIRYDIDVQNQYTNQIATAKARWMF